MADINTLTAYVSRSVYTPLLSSDPAYTQVQTDIPVIINQVILELGYTVASIHNDLQGLLVAMVKKEIYWRLATSTAADLDLETEFTKIIKTKRFDHYFKLISLAQVDIDKYQQPIQVADVTLRSRDFTNRNHELAYTQVNIGITPSAITTTSVNLDWFPFDITLGSFGYYNILVSTAQIYDSYANPVLTPNDPSVIDNIMLIDMRRTQYRIINLKPNTLYYVTIVYHGYNINTYAFAQFTTPAD